MCCGCTACYNVCPLHCITMEYDEEGFAYPKVDHTKCIGCGQCEKVCPMHKDLESSRTIDTYAMMNKDEDNRLRSSSGGMFALLASKILEQSGVVFGAEYETDWKVRHTAIIKEDDLPKLQGSKYQQSILGNTYQEVQKYLRQGKNVLFSGTGCQIAGLKKYLKKDYDNLFCIDVVCHGVPSKILWDKYLDYQQKSYKATVKNINFRDKLTGWKGYSIKILFDNQKEFCERAEDDCFMKIYRSNLALRPSCYECKFKFTNSEADLTIADFWGVEHIIPKMDDDKGTSLVLVHTEKGAKMIRELSGFQSEKINVQDAIRYNPSIQYSVGMPTQREKFMNSLTKSSVKRLAAKYCRTPITVYRIKVCIARGIKKIKLN